MNEQPLSPLATAHPARTWMIVGSLFLVMFTVSSQFLIVAPVLPRIGEALQVQEQYLGMLVTGYAVAVAFFALLAGPISDRFGRRHMLRVGTAGMAVALLLHGFATSFTTLLMLRILAGAFSGVLSGAAVAYIGDVIEYNRRGRAIGVIMAGMAFGQIAGIPMGTILAGWWGFYAPFLVFGVIMVPASVAMLFVLVKPHQEGGGRLTLASGLRTYRDLLKQPSLLAVSLGSAIMMLGVSAFIVYQPKWLEDTFGASPTAIAGLFLVGGIANALVGPIAGRLSDRVGRKGLVVGSSAVVGLLMALPPFLPSFGYMYALFFLIMCCVGARISPLNAWITGLVNDEHRGSLLSLTMAMAQGGFAIGAALAGWLYTGLGYTSNALLAAAAALIAAALLAAFVPERRAGQTEATTPTTTEA